MSFSHRLSVRDRRALTFGVATLGGLFAIGRGLPAVLRWESHERARAEVAVGARARAEHLLRSIPSLTDTLAARRRAFIALAPAIVPGETRASAGAALASLLSGLAMDSEVRVGAAQIRLDSAGSGVFGRVTVSMDVTGDVSGLLSLLAAIERESPRLAVRELAIAQPDANAPSDRMEALRAQLAVQGMMLMARDRRSK